MPNGYTARIRQALLVLTVIPALFTSHTFAAPTATLDIAQIAATIKAARPKVSDPQGWANDILEALRANNLPRTPENICSVVAVTDQESAFAANPAVPNLGKLSQKAMISRLNQYPLLGGKAETLMYQLPNPRQNFMTRIRQAKTERDLDWAYRDLIASIAQAYKISFLMNSDMARDFIESRNEISTLGAMQVDVGFAVQQETARRRRALSLQEIYQLRDALYTRKVGLYYGVARLLGYETGYGQKQYRFADYNAGRYASRNAAFQTVVASLAKQPLATDGDLLIYDRNGAATATISNTEQMVRLVADKYGLILPESRIRSDLLQEKTYAFNQTSTYHTVMEAYRLVKKSAPPYAVVPRIGLRSSKTSRLLTTERYANMVSKRYQRCMAQPARTTTATTSVQQPQQIKPPPAPVATDPPPAPSFLQDWVNRQAI